MHRGYPTALTDLATGKCDQAATVPARSLPSVKRVLLTGMSGTGKSSVVHELLARGYKAVDTDDGWSEPQPNGRQMWREDAIQALLATEDAEVLFVAGCEEKSGEVPLAVGPDHPAESLDPLMGGCDR